jgi:hypothetical protein
MLGREIKVSADAVSAPSFDQETRVQRRTVILRSQSGGREKNN